MKTRNTSLPKRGSVLIYTICVMVFLFGMLSLAVDLGRVQLAKSELYAGAEDAARYAVRGLVAGTAVTRGVSSSTDNSAAGAALGLASADVETGIWNTTTRTFTPTSTDPNAVRVTARRTAAAGNAVQLFFGAAIGKRSTDVSVSTVAYFNMNVMLVVGSTPLAATDQLTYNRIASLGYHPVVVTDSALTAAAALTMRAVVISETVVSSNVNTKLRDIAVPVVCYEPFLSDDFSLSGSVSGTDYGLSNIASRVHIDAPSHPIAQGLSGTVTVSTLSDAATDEYLAWAAIGGGGVKVASIHGTSSRAGVYAFDKGALLVNGSAAPARRVGFFGSGPLGGFLGGVPASTWTANAWTLFDNALLWCVGTDPNVCTVKYTH